MEDCIYLFPQLNCHFTQTHTKNRLIIVLYPDVRPFKMYGLYVHTHLQFQGWDGVGWGRVADEGGGGGQDRGGGGGGAGT